jgi:PadR family transcriptional regulator PadR
MSHLLCHLAAAIGAGTCENITSANTESDRVLLPSRVTVPFLKIFSVFVNNPSEKYSGVDVCKETNLKSGTVYPMLIKLNENGWLTSEWEDIDPKKEKRPQRRFYRITRHGLLSGQKILAEHFPSMQGIGNLETA